MTRLLAITTTLLSAVLLNACAMPYSVLIPVPDGTVVALKPGQTVILVNRGSLRYVRLASDSRCAPDVQCVWAGDAIVAMHWTPAKGESKDLELHTDRARGLDHTDLDGKRVTLTFLSRQGSEASFEVTPAP